MASLRDARVHLIGFDAAAQLKQFGYALGIWSTGKVVITEAGLLESSGVRCSLDERIVPFVRSAPSRVLIAIDAPLGWPSELGTALAKHKAGVPFSEMRANELFRRDTDRNIKERTGKTPLDVGADKIARAAHSALRVLGELRSKTGRQLPLAWDRDFEDVAVIEVYPAGTLAAHQLHASGYKKTDQAALKVRQGLATALAAQLTNLDTYIAMSEHVFDACICLAGAADFLEGKCVGPSNRAKAEQEGWIWARSTS